MDATLAGEKTAGCGRRIICHCLQISELQVIEAVSCYGCETVCDIRRVTGAGDGCMGCRRRLSKFLDNV